MTEEDWWNAVHTCPNDKAVLCPKCGAASGNDWSQCGSQCPVHASPHYDESLWTAYADVSAQVVDG